MRTSTSITLWLIAMLNSVGITFAPPPSSAKRIELSHDFGAIELAKQYSHTFSIKNDFGRQLDIKHVSKSCGCLDSSLSRLKIPPDQQFSVKLSIRITDVGQQEYHQEITLIDPENPPIFIRLKVSAHLPRNARLISQLHFPRTDLLGGQFH